MTPDIAKSTHRVEVVPVVLEKHPDADTLSVVRVFGYTVCVRTADWEGRTVGAYIPPDSVVPDTPEYAFLGENRRIKVRRLRGVVSMGLLVPAPEGAKIGDDVAERLGIGHYEPPLSFKTGGDVEEAPAGYRPVYDVDTWYRYKQLLRPGEEVRVTEKIHGASGRWVFQDGRMWSASRSQWWKPGDENLWWKALKCNPWIEEFCRAAPGATVYGEVYGRVQDLHYGVPPSRVEVAVFDVLSGSDWWPAAKVEAALAGHLVPLLFAGPYDEAKAPLLAEGPSTVPGANHVREGCVIRPVNERTAPEIWRVQLKIVSSAYLERA
jgi:RNA ligase (TIGR02306 family)